MNHPTFTAWRNAVQSSEDTVMHASLPFFALAENRPTPSQPNWVEIACFKRNNNGEGILAYLSLVDAELDRQNFNRDGRGYRIMPFEAIDPRHFIQTHERWLSVYAVYGFAARGAHLLTDDSGRLQALSHIKHFHIAPESEAHFHLNFGEQAIDWLGALHRAAGIPDYANMIEGLAGSSAAEIEQHAQDALRHATTAIGGEGQVTHCALYDTVEGQWRFAAIEDLP